MNIDKIVCVGKNYLEHAQELGDVIPEKPVIFLKPPSVLKQCSAWDETLQLAFPQDRGTVHHEIEIVLQIGVAGYQMTTAQAANAISAVSIGLDMTLRTEQTQLKKQGHPWTIAKVFVDSAIIGPWLTITNFTNYLYSEFSLAINDEIRQQAYGREMTMNPPELISYISHYFPLCQGDIIFTGTPAGVAAVVPGDKASLQWSKYQFNVEWQHNVN